MASISLLLLVVLGLAACSGSKLNVARILLPIFDDLSVNFTLQSTDETCFKWSTNREDVINLDPIDYAADRDCSSRVVVTVTTSERTREAADVVAEDVVTHQILRCVVIVDVIDSLGITTTTRELVLEETPQVFEVRAYDDQGNEFSTLTGVPFNWMITALGPNSDLPVLRFMAFRDSSYETPETLLDMEEYGKRGHKVLIEGVKTGISKVSVRLPQKEYSSVKSNEVQLTVVANLMIVPSEVYVMEGDVVDFKIIHTSYGHSEEIDLQLSQYYLDVEDERVATVPKYESHVMGLKEGTTHVLLRDGNINESEPAIRLPSAAIHVVRPAYMVLSLLPYKNWATLVSEAHTIVAEVYSKDDRKLLLGPNVVVEVDVGEAFHVQKQSTNGTWQTGWTRKAGVADVSARLDSIGNTPLSQPLKASNQILIYPTIKMQPSIVVLPWDPQLRPKYDIEVKASGGDGKFLWSSSNHSVGVVTQYGKVRTSSHGTFDVSVAMQRNHHIRASSKFHIVPPTRLEITQFELDAEVGTPLHLHVALYADVLGARVPFTECRELPFKVTFDDPRFYRLKDEVAEPVADSCGSVAVTSREVGTSKVTVSYQTGDGKVLSDSVTVGQYKRLQLLQPEGLVVLAVGTSLNLVYVGGPRTITGNEHSKYLNSSSAENVRARDVTHMHKLPSDDEYTVVSVSCLKLGSSRVSLTSATSYDIPTCLSCGDRKASVATDVICGKPRSVELYPELKVQNVKSCPMDLSADRVVVKSNQDVDLIVRVKDERGRTFMNVSSLMFDWKMYQEGLAGLGNANSVYERPNLIGSVPVYGKYYQTVRPKVEAGQFSVKATVVGYIRDVLAASQATSEWPEFQDENDRVAVLPPIAANITLYLVDDAVISPNTVSIYNHPANSIYIDVKQGSGYYQIDLSTDDVTEVLYLQKNRQLKVTPKSNGELSVQLTDLCLLSRPAVVTVTVVSVHKLQVDMPDKVEVGKCVPCKVRMYGKLDNLLSVANLDLVDVERHLEKNIATIERNLAQPGQPGELNYIVNGAELGDTKLYFSIGHPDSKGYISSLPVDLQVFPPIRLHPRNATLTVGSKLQYSVKGGPQPTPELEFTVLNTDTAGISPDGIVKGLMAGQTRVQVRAVGTHPTSGQKIIYSEDTVEVNVIKLTNIKIAAPITKFVVGSTVPLWAAAVPDHISPLMLASIEPPVSFSWAVKDSDVLHLQGALESSGIHYEPTDMLSVRLTGVTPGISTVYLNATLRNGKKSVTYTSHIKIEVVEKLILRNGNEINARPLLMAPYTEFELFTNMDDFGKLSYRILGDNPSGTTDVQRPSSSASATQLLTVSERGLVKSYGLLGTALVVVGYVDEGGMQQSLTVPIQVKLIHHMMLSFKSKWTIPQRSTAAVVPLGSEFELEASYYDNVGNRFAASTVELQLTTSRFDLLHVKRQSDSSFLIFARKPGSVAVRVSSEKVVDYIKLRVGQTISPDTKSVTVGDVLCFSTPLIRPGDPGLWTASDGGLLKIDGTTGVAVASKDGQVSVMHSLHLAAPLLVDVRPLQEIVFEGTANETLSNAPNNIFRAFVVLRSGDERKTNNLVCGKNKAKLKSVQLVPPFECGIEFENKDVRPEDVFHVTPKFDVERGQYYCEIVPIAESNKKVNMFTTNAVITARLDGVRSDGRRLSFLPAVEVPHELVINERTSTGTLIMRGLHSILKNIEVKPMDDTILTVYNKRLDDDILSYDVQLLDYHKKLEDNPEFMSISVFSHDNNQRELVLVKALNQVHVLKECLRDGASVIAILHGYRHLLMFVMVPVMVFVVSFYLYTTYFQTPVSINIVAPSLQRPNNVTFNRSCPPGSTILSGGSPTSQTMYTSGSPGPANVSNLNTTCYCTQSPELRRNRRYL